MKQRAAKILLAIFLFAALVPPQVRTELERMPDLVAHFQEHQIENPDLTFIQFLKLHYGEKFAQHRSEHEHGDLPFKCGDHHHTAVVAVVFLLADFPFPLKVNQLPNFEKRQFPPTDRYFSVKTSNIWQPPKA